MAPGGVFVVAGVVSEASVEDSDESVAQGSQGGVVEVSGLASLVVEGSAAGTGVEGTEGPLVNGVIQAPVSHVAGQDGAFLA